MREDQMQKFATNQAEAASQGRRHAEMRDCDFYLLQQKVGVGGLGEGPGERRRRWGPKHMGGSENSSKRRVIDPRGSRLARCLCPDVRF